ncbi:hypothetical protein [Leisingera sp. M523]|uniref:hypothetical protein n=1 Tax=Leisingera sp. M523 TaxID=2867013 RepID=UPI0021A8A149|nr:hypothetical protein [Leisingera sp. M523]UWQ29903.1 hypothetical protein K3557_04965 [Leisingera sp. M523]
MNAHARHLQPIDAEALDEYPISASDRLDSHYFLQWNLKRWRASEFRRKADPEVGWYGMQLFFIAQDETPIGTLPCDDDQLAYELRVPLEKWKALTERKFSPLHNWARVRCDNGEIRWAHPVVTEVAVEALKSKRKNQSNQEQRTRNKRLKDLQVMIENRIGAGQLLRAAGFLERFNDWLEDRYPDVQRREVFIRCALDEFQVEHAA